MITGTVCFVGGIFFAAAFPLPSDMIREYVLRGVRWVRSLLPGKGSD